MTSKELVGLIAGYREFRERGVIIDPEVVYFAGNFAQTEICDEVELLEKLTTLTLVAKKERYQFPAVSVTKITHTIGSPHNVEATSHGFNTGDTAIISGNSLGNGEWKITKVDANNFTLDGSSGTQTQSLTGGTVYHGLFAASRIHAPIKKSKSPYGKIHKKTYAEIETYRERFGDGSITAEVLHFYEIYDEPIIIGFQGIPKETINTEILFIRRPLPSEALSDTVNPIIPRQYDRLLYLGTLYHTLSVMPKEELKQEADKQFQLFEIEKKKVKDRIGRQRIVLEMDRSGIVW